MAIVYNAQNYSLVLEKVLNEGTLIMFAVILIQTHLLCWKQGINVFNSIEVSSIQRVLAGENLKIEQISYES